MKNIRRATRKRQSPEEKIRIVLDGLRGETSIAKLCRREGIAESLYYSWSKEPKSVMNSRGCVSAPQAQEIALYRRDITCNRANTIKRIARAWPPGQRTVPPSVVRVVVREKGV